MPDRLLVCVGHRVLGSCPLAKVHLLRREAAETGQGGLMTAQPPVGDGGGDGEGTGDAPAAAAAVVCVSSESFLEKRGRGSEWRGELDTALTNTCRGASVVCLECR